MNPMFSRMTAVVLGGIALLAGSLIASAADNRTELRFGSVAMDIPTVMHQRLRPLTNYLSRELGQPVVLNLSPNMPAAEDTVAGARVDIAYLTPVAYLNARDKGGVRLVAKTVTKGRSSFRLMIAVRAGSPIHAVGELKGRSFAFGDPAALLQQAVVVDAGMRLEELGSYRFLGHYDNIARGVVNGDFDAGILKDTTAFEWEKKGLRIIHASPELPPYNIVVSSKVSEPLYRKIRAAFLRLDPKNPEHAAVITAIDRNYDGFAPVTDHDYDVVRRLIRPFRNK